MTAASGAGDPGEQGEAARQAILRRNIAISREAAARWPAHPRDFDVDAWLHDENGLPR